MTAHVTHGGGSDFCAAHKISSPGEAYEPARNFVKYKIRKVAVCVDELEQEHFHEHTHEHDHAHPHECECTEDGCSHDQGCDCTAEHGACEPHEHA